MDWFMPAGSQSIIGVSNAAELVRGRLEYVLQRGDTCNREKLLGEALLYATLLRDWARANQPPPAERRDRGNRRGKPGPMSDG